MNKLWIINLQILVILGGTNTLHNFLGLNKPFFNPSSGAVYKAQAGGIAYLTCEVYNLNNLSVSWVRGRDSHILTVDRETFMSDKRFVSMHRGKKMSNTITLSIDEIKVQDKGNYYACSMCAFNMRASMNTKKLASRRRKKYISEW